AEAVMFQFAKIAQSLSELIFYGIFMLRIIHVRMPIGGGMNTNQLTNKTWREFLEKKKSRSVYIINNKDDICLARAIVIAKAVADGEHRLFENMKRTESTQKREAIKLLNMVGIPERTCTLDDIIKISAYMSDYQFLVHNGNIFVHKDPVEKQKKIMLLYDPKSRHFDVIRTFSGLFGKSYFCIECNIAYQHKRKHKCSRGCQACGGGKVNCKRVFTGITCTDCNRFCFNNICFESHKKIGICDRLFRCKICKMLVNMTKRGKGIGFQEHVCFEIYCKQCKGHFRSDHQCFMQPLEDSLKNTKKKFILLFYDFEATQDTLVEGTTYQYEHRVNFVVSK